MDINLPGRDSPPARRESDLYDPIKRFLTERGFIVRGEVKECDIVAIRDDVTVVVELKPIFNLALDLQGIDRQEITPYVYLATEAPTTQHRRSQWKGAKKLCARLGLGLLAVHFSHIDGAALDVEVVREPVVSPVRANSRRRKLLTEEFWQRSGDHTKGGSPRSKSVMTAYRELALHVAAYLQTHGPTGLKDLREAFAIKKVSSIVTRNYYGWFERVRRGVYGITPEGEKALDIYFAVFVRGKHDTGAEKAR